MAIKVILLVLFALCALFLTNTQATSPALSELNRQCENKFWFKDQKDFKKSIKSKCLKEKSHNYYEKKHRKHDVCKNNSHDKKLLLSKWEKFSDCRCGFALVELSDFKVSSIFVCYQIASLNKATGEFVGELTVFKKKSEHNYDIAVRFPKNVKIYNQKGKYKNDYYRLKEDKHPSHAGKFLVEKVLIAGRIPKYDSMNRINTDKISPDEFILVLKNGRVRSLKKDREFVVIPLSKFIPSENYLTKGYEYEYKNKDKDKKKEKIKKPPYESNQPPPPSGNTPPPPPSANPSGNPPPPPPSGNPPPPPPSGSNPPPPSPPSDSGSPGGYGSGSGSPDGYGGGSGTPGGTDGTPGGTDGTPGGADSTPAEPQNDTGYGGGGTMPTPADPQAVTGQDPTSATEEPTNTAAAAGQESSGTKSSGGGISSAAIGSIVFGSIVAVGAAFIGYNTYERIRWRRQYRRRQEVVQQNPSLANVPDYNGYGRAY